MRRRDLLAIFGGATISWPLMARAQQTPKLPRVGLLHQSSLDQGMRASNAFREGMRLLGWIDGKNVAIEDRFADYDTARVSANAVAFAAAKVDVIVAFSGVPARAAREATSSIPIVMDAGDPVGQGLVASLARSGSNVTGQSLMRQDMAAKQLQMLREAIPKATRIAVLQQPDYKLHLQQMAEIERTAVMLGVSVLAVSAGVVQDLPHLFKDMKEAGVDAYLVLNEPRTDVMRGEIAALALQHRLPGMAQDRRYVEAGGLLCYGVNLDAVHRRAAFFVDKILKGADPANLPIEQPIEFDLSVNLKTAKALGLIVPQSILVQAKEVIE
jgi:putative ABC transport system substrate-binding protein